MSTLNIIEIATLAIVLLVTIFLYLSFFTVAEGTYAVINSFGKYKRIAGAGFSFKNPFTESIFKRISIQNNAMEIEFTATTVDQANVDFKALVLYAVIDDKVESLKKVAFKFQNETGFTQALIRSIEAAVRGFVATKKQNEVLVIRHEIAEEVKTQLDKNLFDWGYNLIDLQINDILFDEAIMRSMAQVVSSENLKLAAYHEGEAILIKAQKQAEADKTAIILKGEATAKTEELMADTLVHSAQKLKEIGLDFGYMALVQWIDGIKHIAEHSEGNVIFIDGSSDGLEKTMRQMQGLKQLSKD
jgi:regulator of protease activity HflC (stomatin/prohibitin superfamily)